MAKAGFVLTVAAAALAGSIGAASAADLPVKAPMVAPVIAAYDWSGWYAGVGIGYAWNDTSWRFVLPPNPVITPTYDSAMAGVHGGYQWHFKAWQNGGIVVGMEYSANFALDDYRGQGVACPNALLTCQVRLEDTFTVGGKLGLTWDRFMIYGQGGWAAAQALTRSFVTLTGVVNPDQTKAWHTGWYAGGGIDWVFYQTRGTDWIIGVDYKHMEFDTVRHTDFPGFVTGNTKDIDLTTDQIMARLTVKLNGPYWLFGGAAPVVAKY
jgi:outer membrane immunogenic protein